MQQENLAFGVVHCTTPHQEEAAAIALALVESRLAPCVQIEGPLSSFYRWEGKLCEEREWRLSAKCRISSFETIAQKIKELHSYQVPEIILLPLSASEENYQRWLEENSLPDSV